MSIKIQGQTVVDNDKNIVNAASATFTGTVDAAGFTVNGTALSTGGGDVSTLVETATGTTIAEAKTDDDGDRVLDLNTMVVGVDLGSFYLGKDEVNTPWQHGIFVDATDSTNNDKTRIALYGTGSNDTAVQIIDGVESKNSLWIGHNGQTQFAVESDFTSGININPNLSDRSTIDVYGDGTNTSSAFRIYSGATSKDMLSLSHDGNARFNINTTTWGEGIMLRANDATGSNITVYRDVTDATQTGSAFGIYDSSTSSYTLNMFSDGNIHSTGRIRSDGRLQASYVSGEGQVDIWKGANNDLNSTGVGWSTLASITSGTDNTALGVAAAESLSTGTRNTAIGSNALRGDTTNASNNTGNNNTAVGDYSTYKNTSGTHNTAVGKSSCYQNTTAEYNTGIGAYSLYNNQTSAYNTAVGYTALYNQQNWNQGTALGAFAGRYDTSGNDSADFYDTTCIGYNSRASGHYQVVLGDTNAYTYTNGGSVYSLSDARDKTDVRDTVMGLDFIKSLRPVDYRWDYREDYLQFDPETGNHTPMPRDGSKKRTRFHHGLIAQEVKSAADGLGVDFAGFQDHTINGGGERMTLGYSEFIGPLIKAVQELSAENAALKARLDAAGL